MSSNKRQRLSSKNPYSSPSSHDSLSSLSPTNSRGNSEDEDDDTPGAISTKKAPQKTRPNAIAGKKGPRKVPPPLPVAPPMSVVLSTVPPPPFIPPPSIEEVKPAVLEEKAHPPISSKTLPPVAVPSIVAASTGEGAKIRITTGMVGGKGKKGEEALEKGVAAREEVERRRVEYRGNGQNGAASNGTSSTGLSLKLRVVEREQIKVEEAEVTVVEPEVIEEVKKERPAISEERDNIIKFVTVTNDGAPSSLIILTGLKNIFQKQLPKMPKEYIARLVYDRNHYSMAIVKRGLEVVGGITYRPFESRKFAEIVFCAITGTEQVKGYGSHLMNHLKDHVKKSTQCNHFLTYADNYAIGYFKKQGFSKEVGIGREVWAGYIKDYEGGTIMHCKMLDRINYLDVSNILTNQKEVILGEIRLSSQSHVVHPGLSCFLPENDTGAGKLIISGGIASKRKIDPSQVPGLRESGWTPEMDELTRRPTRHPQFSIMQRLLTVMGDHPSAWAFDHPVNRAEVTDYYDVITEPMDLATMSRKLEANAYKDLDDFLRDARLIFSNCRAYNDVGSNYVKFANKLEQFMNDQLKVYLQ